MKVEVEITDEQIANLLISAFEGGSNYWYEISGQKKPDKYRLFCGKPFEKADTQDHYEATGMWLQAFPDGRWLQVFPHVDYPMNPGGQLIIKQTVDKNGPGRRKLDRTAIERGMNELAASEKYRHHFVDIVKDDTGATTGDVFLQMCLYGDVIYG